MRMIATALLPLMTCSFCVARPNVILSANILIEAPRPLATRASSSYGPIKGRVMPGTSENAANQTAEVSTGPAAPASELTQVFLKHDSWSGGGTWTASRRPLPHTPSS
jgi:hypothetical protein